jgi:hypothetical protein
MYKNKINNLTLQFSTRKIINELCHFYKVSLIKTGLMFHKYHLLNQLQVFMRYKKNTKMSFNIPLRAKQIVLTCTRFLLIEMKFAMFFILFYIKA